MIAADTETHLITQGNLAPRLVCLTWYDGEQTHIVPYDKAEAVVLGWLERGETVIWHNASFDVAVLMANYPNLIAPLLRAYDKGSIRCTKIRHMLRKVALGTLQFDPTNGNKPARSDLAWCVEEYLGEHIDPATKNDDDAWRFRYSELDGVPIVDWPTPAVEYAVSDAVYCWRIFLQQPDLPNEIAQTQAALALHIMACWGVRADPARVVEYAERIELAVADWQKKLTDLGIVVNGKMNLTTVKALVTEAYDGTPPLTDKGAVKYSRSVLLDTPCIGEPCEGDEVCQSTLHIIAASTADRGERTKYLPWLQKMVEGPVNVSVQPLLATGRCSLAKPPIQQWPRRVGPRQCIVASPGCVFVGADYSQIELVCLGQILLDLFGKSVLAEQIQAGTDIHLFVASRLLQRTYEDVYADRNNPAVEKTRQISKVVDYGLPGGMGPDTFVEFARQWGLVVTREEVVNLKLLWRDTFPEMTMYFRYISDLISRTGDTCDIEQLRSKRIRGRVRYCEACNTLFQGLAADMAKDALWQVTKEQFLGRLQGSRLAIFAHDENILDTPVDLASEHGEILSEIMVAAGRRWCPDMPIVAEPYITKHWDKRAKTVRDEQGRLMQWHSPI